MNRAATLAFLLLLASPALAQPLLPATTVTVAADWPKSMVAVSGAFADLPAGDLLAANRQPLPADILAKRIPTGVAVAGPAASVFRLLAPGTRSLALAVGTDGPLLRLDLPAPDITAITKASDDAKDTQTLAVAVPGALPGAVLMVAEWPATDALQPKPASVLATNVTAALSLIDRAPAGDPPAFRVRFPTRAADAPPLALVFQAKNPDGSLTRAARVVLNGNEPDKELTAAKPARPAPITDDVDAPTCLLLTAAKAADACTTAGVLPILYDPADGRELTATEAADATVSAQGVEPGKPMRRGAVLLLAVKPALTVPVPEQFSAAGIEVDAPFGFAPLHPGGLLGLLPSARPAPIVTSTKNDEETDDPRVALADPGVALDPTRKADDDRFAAAVQDVLGGVRDSDADNPLAAAVREATDAHESAVVDTLKAGKGTDQLPVEKVLDAVSGKLGMKLSDADRAATAAAWRAEVGKLPAYALDQNRDGRIADDIAALLVKLLWKQGKYDPAAHFQVLPGKGGSVAVLPQKPVDPSWKKPGLTVIDGAGPAVTIPKGPAATAGASQPDQVRVPAVKEGELVKDYIVRLRAVGLKFKKVQDKVFAGDPVTSVEPSARQWVAIGSAVSVRVGRRTPNVVGKTFAEATKLLADHDLRATPTIAKLKPADGDEVAEQMPRENEIAPPNGVVYVRCKRKVPDVVGKPARDAIEKLRDEWFDADCIDRLAVHDTILAQLPEAGQPAPLNTQVALLVRRPIPDVAGTRYADAVMKLREYGWRVSNPDAFDKVPGPWVLKQNVPAGKIVKMLPDFDTTKLVMELTPGMKVPSVQDRSPGSARELLAAVGLKGVYTEPATPFWKVDGQDPPAGELVALGTEVKLKLKDTGKKVPPVIGLAIAAAKADLDGHGVKYEFVAEPIGGEVVVGQTPVAGTIIGPDTAVKLAPGYRVPELRQRTLAAAKAVLDAAGGKLADPPRERVVTTEIDSEDGKTEVEGQTPEPGALLERGKTVAIAVVRYQYRDARLTVPRFIDKTEAQADQDADGKFALAKTPATQETNNPRLVGQTVVTAQNPPEGTKANRGDSVAITVTQYVAGQQPAGVDKVAVPNFRGNTPDEAQNQATGKVIIDFVFRAQATHDADLAGKTRVVGQSIAAGTEVEVGTAVKLSAVQYHRPNVDPPDPPPARKVAVPPVVNEEVSQALRELQQARLRPVPDGATREETTDRTKFNKSFVRSTNPAPNTLVPVDSPVRYSVVHYVPKPQPQKELTAFAEKWYILYDQGAKRKYEPGRCVLSADRNSLVVNGTLHTFEDKPGAKPGIGHKSEPKQLTGTRVNGAPAGFIDYRLSNGVELRIPDTGRGAGQWKAGSGAWNSLGINRVPVHFGDGTH